MLRLVFGGYVTPLHHHSGRALVVYLIFLYGAARADNFRPGIFSEKSSREDAITALRAHLVLASSAAEHLLLADLSRRAVVQMTI